MLIELRIGIIIEGSTKGLVAATISLKDWK
jgi:hypothetical protein